MGIQVSLSENGYLTPIAFGTGIEDTNGGTKALTENTVVIIREAQGSDSDADTIFTLPEPLTDENWGGHQIVVKVLWEGSGEFPTLTFQGANSDVMIDKDTEGLEVTENLTSLSFYYLNEDYGWITGPASF